MKRFKKIGGGSFETYSGKIVKPNEIFKADPDDIPKAFRDIVVEVDPDPNPQPEPKTEEIEVHEYTKEPKSKGWYDVVDSNGKVMNEKSLRDAEADELIKNLSNG